MDLLNEYNNMINKPTPKLIKGEGGTVWIDGKMIGTIVDYSYQVCPADPDAKIVQAEAAPKGGIKFGPRQSTFTFSIKDSE
jgi:hypothetical protein